MTQPRKLAPTTYIPTGLNSLDGWPTLPETSDPVSEPRLFSRLGRTVSRFLFDAPRHEALLPDGRAA